MCFHCVSRLRSFLIPYHPSHFLNTLYLVHFFESANYSFSHPERQTGPTATPTHAPTPHPTHAPTEARFPCPICGFGEELTEPNALLFTADGIPVTCAQAQSVGGPFGAGYTPNECFLLQGLAANSCGCTGPTPAPVPGTVAPSEAPETVFCTVCFNGNPAMGAGSIGGELCQDLDKMGRESQFTEQECLIIQTAAAVAEEDPCECIDPTASPTARPTPVPSPQPSAAPTPRTCIICAALFDPNFDFFSLDEDGNNVGLISPHSLYLPCFSIPFAINSTDGCTDTSSYSL